MTTLLTLFAAFAYALVAPVAITGTGRMALHAAVLVRRRTGAPGLRLKTVRRRLGASYHGIAAAIGIATLLAGLGLFVPAAAAPDIVLHVAALASLLYFVLRP